MRGKVFFLSGGISLLMIFLLHVLIAVKGGDYYRHFGAGEEFARMSENGSMFPALITLLLSVVFLTMSFYAFSGANLFKRLPFLRLVLLAISAVFVLRGLFVIPEMFMGYAASVITKEMMFSLVSLVIGLLLLLGIVLDWKLLKDN